MRGFQFDSGWGRHKTMADGMMIEKRCSNKECTEQNPQSVKNFYKRGDVPVGLYSRCKSCCNKADKNREEKLQKYKRKWDENNKEKKKEYYHENKEVISKKQKIYNRKTKKERKNYELMRNYGITLEQYNSMLISQNHKCAIYEVDEVYAGKYGLFVDHNHSNDQVRALLCRKCNFLIGQAGEDTNVLQKAIEYLNSFESCDIIDIQEYKSAK